MKSKIYYNTISALIVLFSLQIQAQSFESSPSMRLNATGLEIGNNLPDSLEVYTAEGNKIKVTDLFKAKPTVIVSGCLTCPVFLRTYPSVEAVYNDYRDKVNFYFLYKTLAHPENNGYIQPITIEERLRHIVDAKEMLQTKIPWLADPMTNEVSSTFGLTPNSEFLFDTNGSIQYMNTWSDATDLRKALTELVGTSDKITTIESLNLPDVVKMSSPSEKVTTRIKVEETLIPIVVKPDSDGSIYYVKLRAEVTKDLLQNGSGKLYLGFHLDPIHNVHWNNLVDPLKYEMTILNGTNIKEAIGIAPVISQASDGEPREFFIEVNNWKSENQIPIKITYFACDDEDKWCKIVVQNYKLVLDTDSFAGGVIGRSFRAGGSQARGRGQGMRAGNMIERMMSFDKNKDGLISKSEFPERMRDRFDRMDANNDGFLSKDELSNMRRR